MGSFHCLRMNLRRIAPLAACWLGLLRPAYPQGPGDAKGKQVIDSALQALGGSNFLAMQTRTASGRVYSFFHDRLSGLDLATIYTQYLASRPANGLAIEEREVLGKKHDYSYLFLPDQGWDVTYRGARPIPDENWQNYIRSTGNEYSVYPARAEY